MNRYVSAINPTAQYESPAAMRQPAVPPVPEDNYLKRSLPFGISPTTHYKEEADEYGTTLPPSPKDNIDNDPACVSCKSYKDPFRRGDCYTLFSPDQNIWGKVCGVKNVNWVRGNQFGVGYYPEKIWKKTEYRVQPPAVRRRYTDIVVPTSDYPNQDYFLQAFSEYKDYPYFDKKECGLPEYTYPYLLTDKQSDVQVMEGFGFANRCRKGWPVAVVLAIIFVIIMFIILRRK